MSCLRIGEAKNTSVLLLQMYNRNEPTADIDASKIIVLLAELEREGLQYGGQQFLKLSFRATS